MMKYRGAFSRYSYLEVHVWTNLQLDRDMITAYWYDEPTMPRDLRAILTRIKEGLLRDPGIASVMVDVDEPVHHRKIGRKLFTREGLSDGRDRD